MRPRPRLPVALLALALPAAVVAQMPASDAPLSVSLRPAFQVEVGFASAGWSDGALSSAHGPTLTFSRRVVGPVRGVFDFATLSGNTLSGSGVEPARHYLVDAGLAVAPELVVAGHFVQPVVSAGIGTLVSDPAADSSSTRSQNAWQLSAGLVVGVYGPLTLGLHYRRVRLSLQDVAAQGPTSTATPVSAHVLEVGLGVRF